MKSKYFYKQVLYIYITAITILPYKLIILLNLIENPRGRSGGWVLSPTINLHNSFLLRLKVVFYLRASGRNNVGWDSLGGDSDGGWGGGSGLGGVFTVRGEGECTANVKN